MKGALFKLDFRKAYDFVRWCFLEHVLRGIGFGDRWVGWVISCITLASVSILLNGSPLPPTPVEKGLR